MVDCCRNGWCENTDYGGRPLPCPIHRPSLPRPVDFIDVEFTVVEERQLLRIAGDVAGADD